VKQNVQKNLVTKPLENTAALYVLQSVITRWEKLIFLFRGDDKPLKLGKNKNNRVTDTTTLNTKVHGHRVSTSFLRHIVGRYVRVTLVI